LSEHENTAVSSIEATASGFIAKGQAYEDLRPVVRTAVELADNLLKVINNVVGLPADYINTHLDSFRKRLRNQIGSIPDGKLTSPPLRIGCAVVKEVAYAAEEPDIQKMFADLLATSCNIDTQQLAHPGFANVITQMIPLDAKVLRYISSQRLRGVGIEKPVNLHGLKMVFGVGPGNAKEFSTSVDNLARLGLIEKIDTPLHAQDSRVRFHGVRQDSIVASVMPTTFGARFVLACILKEDAGGEDAEASSENTSSADR
jgi:hypothetical protein